MRKRALPKDESTPAKEFDLLDHKVKILKTFEDDPGGSIELNGMKFVFSLMTVSNVDYVSVSPANGSFVPCANLIRNERQYREEMERRATPLHEQKPRPNKTSTPPRKR